MVSLMSDSRVVFLLWFIGIAVAVAVVLISIEVRLNRKRVREAAVRKKKTPVDLMREFLAKDVSVREKLDVVGKTAKDYFKGEYGLSERLDYGELAKKFEGRGQDLEVDFCEKMFEAYYSDHGLNSIVVGKLGDMVEEIYKKKRSSQKLSSVPGFGDRVDMFLEGVKNFFIKKEKKRAKVLGDISKRSERVAARQEYELVSWVRKAIRMGYDGVKILGLLDDGERSKHEVKEALKIYKKEVSKNEDTGNVGFYGEGGGVARRIVENERDRLRGEEVLTR